MDNIDDNKALFETMPVWQSIRIMAVPAIISQLIVLIYNLADTFFVGKTSDPNMVAGVSLILPVFNITLALGGLCGIGGGALIPKLMALSKNDEAEKVNMYCIKFSLIIAAAFSLVMGVFMKPILTLLGASEKTYPYASKYVLLVIVCGAIPTVLANVLSNLIRSLGMSKEAGIGVALGGILNIGLDPLFMFVILPEGNEVLGVGIATLISNVISCTYCFYVMIKKQKTLKMSLKIGNPSADSIKKVIIVGIPGAVNTLLFDLDYMVLDKLMAGYGEIPLAGIGIELKAERFPISVGLGLCQAIVPLVSYCSAKRDFDRMKSIIKRSALIGIVIGIASIIVYEFTSPYIIMAFIDNPETIEIGAYFLRARAFATIFMFLSFFVVHLFQAFGKGMSALLCGTFRWAVLNIPMLYIFDALFGMNGIVWSQVSADVIVVAVTMLYLRSSIKKLTSSAPQMEDR